MTYTKKPYRSSRCRCAFSLVELVIVVVIIGIISGIAVTRIASASRKSAESALMGTLSTFRSVIDIYAAEHGGDFPGAKADGSGGAAYTETAFVSQMTKYSNSAGAVANTWDAQHIYGPYIRIISPIPVGPNIGATSVAIDVSNSPPLVNGGGEAWVYNPLTGEIIANTDAANLNASRAYDEY